MTTSKRIRDDFIIIRKYLNKANNAKERGIPFDLTLEEFTKVISSTHCAYTGKLFGNNQDSQLTIEREWSTEGYTVSNTIAVTKAANVQKSFLDKFMKEKHIPVEMKEILLNSALKELRLRKLVN